MKKALNLVVFICSINFAYAQLHVDTFATANEMINDFFGNEMNQVAIIDIQGFRNQIGFFDGSNSDLGLEAGMVLSTGNIFHLIDTTFENGGTMYDVPGDDNLDTDSGQLTMDAASFTIRLERDFTDTVFFSFVFGSNEYNEFVGDDFNDAFAFYVEGGKYDSYTNMAQLPNTETLVSINNVNLLASQEYFIDYIATGGFQVGLDGLTTVINSSFVPEANIPYNIKVVIADAVDGFYDSAVFLSTSSLGGNKNIKPISSSKISGSESTVHFKNTSSYTSESFWDFGDGEVSLDRNPSHTYEDSGNYLVTLINKNYCCLDTQQFTVPVQTLPSDLQICNSENRIDLTVQNLEEGQTSTWKLIMGDGLIVVDSLVFSSYIDFNIGTHLIENTVMTDSPDSSFVTKDTLVVTVVDSSSFGILELDSIFCLNAESSLIGLKNDLGVVSGPGVVNNTFAPEIAGPGSHLLYFEYRASENCTVLDTQEVNVINQPYLDYEFDEVVFCSSADTLFLDTISLNGGYFGTGVDGHTLITSSIASGGSEIIYEINDEGCVQKYIVPIFKNEAPDRPVITYEGDSLIASGMTDSYIWFFDSELLADTSQTISFSMNGNYNVIAVLNDCLSPVSETFTFSGVDDLREVGLTISPNPASSFLSVAGDSMDDVKRIEIIDMQGRVIRQFTNTVQNFIGDIANGHYTIRVRTSKKVFSNKLVISR